METVDTYLAAIQSGDREALEPLVRPESGRLHAIAYRVTGDEALADDIVQDVFLRVLDGRAPTVIFRLLIESSSSGKGVDPNCRGGP